MTYPAIEVFVCLRSGYIPGTRVDVPEFTEVIGLVDGDQEDYAKLLCAQAQAIEVDHYIYDLYDPADHSFTTWSAAATEHTEHLDKGGYEGGSYGRYYYEKWTVAAEYNNNSKRINESINEV